MSEEILDHYVGVRDWKFKEHTECDVCRKILVATGGTVWFSQLSGDNEEERKEVQHNLGDYQIGKQYTICWECILRRCGVKP